VTPVVCDLCGSADDAPVMAQADPRSSEGAGLLRVVECRRCGLLYLNPRPEGADLAAYYPDDYYDNLAAGTNRVTPGSDVGRELHHAIRRALLQRYYGYPICAGRGEPARCVLPRWIGASCARLERWRLQVSGREAAIIPFVGQGQLLDVGCGTGKDLLRLQRSGWAVTGVEISPYAAALARARLGCEVVVGHFDEVVLEGRCFDVVRLSHVLEHLPSPRKSLEKVRRLLRPGGLLWLEVPNAASAERRWFGRHWYQWDLPRHLYHFTPATLGRLLREVGFQPRKVKCDGRMAFFAESLADVLAERVGLRRRTGKKVARLAKPLVYALGAMNLGGILTAHAVRD
jgi:SAM-dependent methyltransferase